jgi:hypothetical protein
MILLGLRCSAITIVMFYVVLCDFNVIELVGLVTDNPDGLELRLSFL